MDLGYFPNDHTFPLKSNTKTLTVFSLDFCLDLKFLLLACQPRGLLKITQATSLLFSDKLLLAS